jgi:hypothetical protein
LKINPLKLVSRPWKRHGQTFSTNRAVQYSAQSIILQVWPGAAVLSKLYMAFETKCNKKIGARVKPEAFKKRTTSVGVRR